MLLPAKWSTNVTASWYIDCPIIIFHIGTVIKGVVLLSGVRSNTLGDGGSVASASAARVSWIRFTHISCTAVSTDVSLELATDVTKASPTEVKVIVIWN